jgi:ABC-type uncharacterized transport system permease subunit
MAKMARGSVTLAVLQAVVLSSALLVLAENGPLVVDKAGIDQIFYGIGGLSGGGATTRLLIDYQGKPPPLHPSPGFPLGVSGIGRVRRLMSP